MGAAVIVWQHPPEHPALGQAIWRLLGPRLRGCAAVIDPLPQLRAGMERMAVRDADQRVAQLLLELRA
jgi:UDP-N-acetylglucosamine--N-acetylmuramyl-(pentapeptide) pyrophosphoryl-undecaprenol N-acetylglucosamine transferase